MDYFFDAAHQNDLRSMEAIANDQARELEPNRPEDFNLPQDITLEVPVNRSNMRDPATWTQLAMAPPTHYTWGLFSATAGGRPNGEALAPGGDVG
eukprot:11472700-Heterocapsa_arctica.AAC.1